MLTTNANDSWSASRGVVFQATATQTISSISLYQDLTGITVNYEIDQTTSASGNHRHREDVLRSGSGMFTTAGLQFITFPIAPLPLTAGNFYQVRFDFARNSNQNFYYNNNNVVVQPSPASAQIDGTQGDDTGNSVMPRIQLGPASPPVDVDATIPTLSRCCSQRCRCCWPAPARSRSAAASVPSADPSGPRVSGGRPGFGATRRCRLCQRERPLLNARPPRSIRSSRVDILGAPAFCAPVCP